MSVIASIITSQFAILKADTKAVDNATGKVLQVHKAMKLEYNGGVILIGFCGAMAFFHKDTYDHIKSKEKVLFQIYDTATLSVAEEIGGYLKDSLGPLFKIAVNNGEINSTKSLVIHIIAKRDHETNKHCIGKVIIDYSVVPPVVSNGVFGLDGNPYIMINNGADPSQDKLNGLYNNRILNTADFDSVDKDFEDCMKQAIAVAPAHCGGDCKMNCVRS